VFVFAGGAAGSPHIPVIDIAAIEQTAALVIAADSGLDHAERAGITPDLVVGDMDSVSPAALERARTAGQHIELHPTDKDATDLELALDAALSRGHARAVIVGGGGGRLSHLLGNATLLADERYRQLEIEWWLGSTRVLVARAGRPVRIEGSPGALVSLIPLQPAMEITSEGLQWELDADALELGTSRGISNRLVGGAASVTTGTGVLLVVVERGDA
jgi:thiamine pyrophosphokinase